MPRFVVRLGMDHFPSAKLRLIIRLDEFGDAAAIADTPTKTTKNLNGVKDPRSALTVVNDPAAPANERRFLLLPQGQTEAQPATSYQRSSDGLTFDVTIVPKTMQIGLNGIRTANTIKAQFRFIDLPIDPRLARSIALEAFAGDVSFAEFSQGLNGKFRPNNGGSEDGLPISVINDTYIDDQGRQRTNSRFLGWVDEFEIEWDEQGEGMVSINGRDNTSLLIEQEMAFKLTLDMSKPIDEAVALFLSHYPQMQGLTVQYIPGGVEVPILKNVLANTAYRPQLGPHASSATGATHKMAIWDYLTDVMGSIGHIIRVDGTNIIIQLPRTLMTRTAVRRGDDPFQGRTLSNGESFDYRRFIYGRNTKAQRITRKFAKGIPQNIEVRSYIGGGKSLLVERFPLPGDRIKHVIPGNSQPDQKWEEIRVYGITDKKTLKTVAQSYYESQGRNELAIEIRTKDLWSYGGTDRDTDILDMKEGDTFELLTNRESLDESSTINKLETTQTSQSRSELFMQSLGMSADFAKAYAKAYNDAGFLTQFRLKSLEINWDMDEGIDLVVHGVNYIEVRLDKSQAPGDEPSDFTSNQPPTKINGQ